MTSRIKRMSEETAEDVEEMGVKVMAAAGKLRSCEGDREMARDAIAYCFTPRNTTNFESWQSVAFYFDTLAIAHRTYERAAAAAAAAYGELEQRRLEMANMTERRLMAEGRNKA